MKALILTSALFLTACGNDPIIRTELLKPEIPDHLLRPVEVICPGGYTSRALGECALAYKHGLNTANGQIAAISEALK